MKSMAGTNRIHRIRLVIHLLSIAALCLAFGFTTERVRMQGPNAAASKADLLIINGKVVDGSGKGARQADVAIRGDRIVFVGDARKAKLEAARTIDATGMIVSPGFIDGHTHTLGDLSNEQTKSNQAFLMQGVTTVVTGNDGNSAQNIGDTLLKWETQGI